MADRPPQYNMVPQGFNMLQQQQQAQQQAQQQQQLQLQQGGQQQLQSDSHPGPGFPALWQQQAMQQQFRPRSGAGVGANQAQMNELMRSQNMARAASGQQMPFGMVGGMPNMGGQQPFHDPSSNQSANGNMPGGGFPNLSGMMNQGMNPAQAQQQRGNLPQQRQLDLIMAHNQNNPSMNFAKFPQNQISQRPDQPQQHPQQPFLNSGMNHSSPDIFPPGTSNDAIRRGSPSNPPNAMAGMHPSMSGAGSGGGGPMTMAQAHERAGQIRMSIQNDENALNQLKLQAQRAGTITDEDKVRHARLMTQVAGKKDYLAKMVSMLQGAMPQQLTGGGNGGPGPGWGGQGGNGTPFDQNIQRNPTPMQPAQHPQGPPGGSLQGGNPGMVKPQTPLNQQAGLPPNPQQLTPQHNPTGQRMGPPQGGNGGQPPFPQAMNGAGRGTPQMSGAGTSGMPSNPGPGSYQPQALERGAFERTLKSFYTQRNFACDLTSLVIDNRPVDLWALHKTVFDMGGFCKIEAANAWDIVGGKLGFVNFPGSDGQPPRSGPGISLQITQYYKDYVQAFDAAYLRTMVESRIKSGTGLQELTDQHRNQVYMMVRSYTGFDLTPGGGARPVNAQKMPTDQQMTQMVAFAHRTVPELRQMGVPENIIQVVEARRPDLQRIYQDQVNFKGMVQSGNNGMRPGQQQSLMQNGVGGPGGMGGRPMQPPFGAAAGGLPGQMQSAQRILAPGGMPTTQGNFMDARLHGQQGMQMGGPLGPPLPQHQQAGPAQQRMLSGMASQMAGGQFHATIPTKEQTQVALVNLAKHRREAQEAMHHLQPIEIPPDQRAAYNSLLENVHRMTLDFDPKLPILYSLMKNDERVGRVVKIISTVQLQRNLCSQSNPRIIIGFEALRAAQVELVRLNDAFSLAVKQAESMRQNQGPQQQQFMQGHQQSQIQLAIQHQMSQQQGMNSMSPPGGQLQDHNRPPMPNQQHPPSAVPHPQGQPQQTTPNLSAQQLRPSGMSLNPPPTRRPKAGSAMTPSAMQSPSPAPAASTPPNAPTPNAMVSSPAQVPKSPKTKAPPKAKATTSAAKRRPSKVAPSPAGTAQTPHSQASPEASTSTPVQAHASIKRQREEDAAPSPGPANGPSPPKRVKMEEIQSISGQAQQKVPEAGPSGPIKKEEMSNEISHIKTGEDASQFLDQMTELIKFAATNADGGSSQNGPETLTGDISETLELLLKGCGPADTGADGGNPFAGFADIAAPPRDGTPPPASLFDEFFDFSNVGEEEDSKVDTPELVSSSSTNPSPESNASEVSDAHHFQQFGASTSGGKGGFDDVSDAVRLGHWKEIDGGEAAYFQSNDWKWEGQMATVDHPWAIFNQ